MSQHTMKIVNNPIDLLLSGFEKEYPEAAKKINRIAFGEVDNGFAMTTFDDDGRAEIILSPTIKDGAEITFLIATELLAHELAHIIAGADAEHGEEWEKHCDRLFELYMIEAENALQE